MVLDQSDLLECHLEVSFWFLIAIYFKKKSTAATDDEEKWDS